MSIKSAGTGLPGLSGTMTDINKPFVPELSLKKDNEAIFQCLQRETLALYIVCVCTSHVYTPIRDKGAKASPLIPRMVLCVAALVRGGGK